MSTVAASIIAATLKSQIAATSGKVATVNPQSNLARFIFGELKGGEHKHNFSMSIISAAVEQAFKGNTRDIPEAIRLCDGKAVKARAFLAGFHAIADMVKPVIYVGKFDSKENADVRANVAELTASTMLAFERDYLDVFASAKQEAKDKKEAKANAVVAVADAPAVAADAPVMTLDAEVTSTSSALDVVCSALSMGLLDASELLALRVALSSYDSLLEQVAPITVSAPIKIKAKAKNKASVKDLAGIAALSAVVNTTEMHQAA